MGDCPIVAAIAIVVRDSELLLVRRANPPDQGLWGFPGGKVEVGEKLTDAAVRELWEETSVVARPLEVFTAVDVIDRDARGDVRHHYVLGAVLCEWVEGTPTASDDAIDAGWYDLPAIEARATAQSFGVCSTARQAVALMDVREALKAEGQLS